jgi:hypothetical protein
MKRIILFAISMLVILISVSGAIVFADAMETTSITTAKNNLLKMESTESVNPVQYKENLTVLNKIISEKDMEKVPITITFTESQNLDELLVFSNENQVNIDSLEIRLLENDEKRNTLFIKDQDLQKSFMYANQIANENNMKLIGVISANLIVDTNQIASLEKNTRVFSVDASAVSVK